MRVPLQVTYRKIRKSGTLDARVREKAAKLEEFHPNITSCRVVIEERHRHQRQGREFTVAVDARVPGHEIFVDRDHDEDVYVALRDAFDAAARKLEEVARLQRGDVKAHAQP